MTSKPALHSRHLPQLSDREHTLKQRHLSHRRASLVLSHSLIIDSSPSELALSVDYISVPSCMLHFLIASLRYFSKYSAYWQLFFALNLGSYRVCLSSSAVAARLRCYAASDPSSSISEVILIGSCFGSGFSRYLYWANFWAFGQ